MPTTTLILIIIVKEFLMICNRRTTVSDLYNGVSVKKGGDTPEDPDKGDKWKLNDLKPGNQRQAEGEVINFG